MKKLLLLMTCFVFVGTIAFGGGIVHNSNQSAYWVRALVRDASTGPDAVFFNPAGLTKLEDGFHFSLTSETIFQSKDVSNNYVSLNPTPKKYLGEIMVPVYPALYATWKKNKIAVSFGFNPIGGGGGATFEDGLPAFEMSVADMVPAINRFGTALGVTATDYRFDVYFKGTSMYLGYQLGATYQINDVISVYAGLRYVSVKNTYEGHLRDVEANVNGVWTNVSTAFDNFSTQYAALAAQATAGATAATTISGTMGALIGGGLPSTATLADAEAAGAINATQRATIEGGLTAMAIPTTLQLGQIQTATTTAAAAYTSGATQASGASALASSTATATGNAFDQNADVEQKGHGFTPIIGVNLALSDKLNIGMKYEFKTTIDVENDTKSGFVGANGEMFPDGKKVSSDLPAMFSLGIDYKITPKFSATTGLHYYMDKGVGYGKTNDEGEEIENSDIVDNNYIEWGLGLEYGITDKLFISGGYLLAKTGVSEAYQSDLSFSLTSNTAGGGLGYKITDKIMVNLGVAYTAYIDGTKDYAHTSQATGEDIMVTDTYYKNNLIFGLGLDVSF